VRAARGILGTVALVAACCAIGPAQAAADDADAVPPQTDAQMSPWAGPNQTPSGRVAAGSPPSDGLYTPDSSVTAACELDGTPFACSVSWSPWPPPLPPPVAGATVAAGPGLGLFTGPLAPQTTLDGPHVVTAAATDEDGTDATPDQVSFVYDSVRPAPPRLLQRPRKRSRDASPRFKIASFDDVRLFGNEAPLDLRVRPLGSTRGVRDVHNAVACTAEGRSCSVSGRLEVWRRRGRGPRRLQPGRYELVAWATDAGGNGAASKPYRFTVLGPKR
jgi:hypothetical protein